MGGASKRNIVICCDGTGNDYSRTPSNVLRLYKLVLKKDGDQIVCYHPGIGTLDRPEGRTRLGRRLRHWRELGFGEGVIENVVELYAYLMREYQSKDDIYLFGFSRGAFTARALAGMLHVCGLLQREDEHLLAYAAGLYRTSERRIRRSLRSEGLCYAPRGDDHAARDHKARDFKSLVGRACPIHFMGLWDTVKAYGWLWPQSFPALRHNPSVQSLRHAVALDERRPVFQVTGWGERREPKCGVPWEPVQEVWFAGDHANVGGGHESGNTSLTDASLAWMLGEAIAAGLVLDKTAREEAERIRAEGGKASSATTSDLRRRYWYTYTLPRWDLDNRTYPPGHWPTWFWASGVRQPVRHAEDHPILLHETIRDRGPGYQPEALRRRTRLAYTDPEPAFAYVQTRDPMVAVRQIGESSPDR